MEGFSIGDVYRDRDSNLSIDINPLPHKHCTFDCVFCPLGRTQSKTDKAYCFNETEDFMQRLEEVLRSEKIDFVNIIPDGEGLTNRDLEKIVDLIKKFNVKVTLMTNGYILADEDYRNLLMKVDEVIGELSVVSEEDFQKLLRPISGFTLLDYVNNMAEFKRWYEGRFVIDINILRGYSDGENKVKKLKEFVSIINPDEILINTPSGRGNISKAFEVSQDRLAEIRKEIN